MTEPRENLLATFGTTPATKLPEDPAALEIQEHGKERFVEIVRAHPESSLCWAMLAEGALTLGTPDGDVTAYAYARTGYHRGLDALRRAGWKGQGPIPWSTAPIVVSSGRCGLLPWPRIASARRPNTSAAPSSCAIPRSRPMTS